MSDDQFRGVTTWRCPKHGIETDPVWMSEIPYCSEGECESRVVLEKGAARDMAKAEWNAVPKKATSTRRNQVTKEVVPEPAKPEPANPEVEAHPPIATQLTTNYPQISQSRSGVVTSAIAAIEETIADAEERIALLNSELADVKKRIYIEEDAIAAMRDGLDGLKVTLARIEGLPDPKPVVRTKPREYAQNPPSKGAQIHEAIRTLGKATTAEVAAKAREINPRIRADTCSAQLCLLAKRGLVERVGKQKIQSDGRGGKYTVIWRALDLEERKLPS